MPFEVFSANSIFGRFLEATGNSRIMLAPDEISGVGSKLFVNNVLSEIMKSWAKCSWGLGGSGSGSGIGKGGGVTGSG